MTLVVCPNLAVDRVVATAALCPGKLTRCRALHQQAGGKGANVARALLALRGRQALGNDRLLGFAAGQTGRLLAALADQEGLATTLVTCAGETRISTVVLSEDGLATPLFERGPEITADDEAALLAAVAACPAKPGQWGIVDGAVPPGADADFYGSICRELRAAGYRVTVDAAGRQLARSLTAQPDLVKVNITEARSAVGAPRSHRADPESPSAAELHSEGLELCRRLVSAGARNASVTLGAAGAVAAIDGRLWRVQTPPVAARNNVGSGDCFAASPITGRFDLDLARRLASLASVEPSAP